MSLLGNYSILSKLNPYPLGALPYFWLDATSRSYYTNIDDPNLGRIVDTVTGRDGTFTISPYDGSLTAKPSFNGEGYYFNSVNALKSGVASNWNGFHNGNNFTIYFSWKQLAMSNTYNAFLCCTNNGTSTQIGLSIAVDNRTANSRTNAIVLSITKGINGQAPISVATNNAVIPNAYNWGKITFDGTNVRVYTNGVLRSTTAPAFAFVATNASNPLFIGASSSLGTASVIYLKHLMLFTSLLSAGDQSLLDHWIAIENTKVVVPTPLNVYILTGQSNADGRALNSQISPQLNGRVGAYIFKLNGALNSASHWDELQLGVNQQIDSVSTQHGIEMRFGYQMNLNDPGNVAIIKYAIGGTAMAVTADAAGDWNVSSSGELYDKIRVNVLSNAVREMEHVLRRTPVFRGFIESQGESDSILARGAAYKTNYTNFVNGVIDYINTTLGIATPKIRLFIFRTKNGGSGGYDPTDYANVVAAQQDVGSNYLTDNPTYATKVKATTSQTTDDIPLLDTQHYSTVGINTMGNRAVTYFEQYQNE